MIWCLCRIDCTFWKNYLFVFLNEIFSAWWNTYCPPLLGILLYFLPPLSTHPILSACCCLTYRLLLVDLYLLSCCSVPLYIHSFTHPIFSAWFCITYHPHPLGIRLRSSTPISLLSLLLSYLSCTYFSLILINLIYFSFCCSCSFLSLAWSSLPATYFINTYRTVYLFLAFYYSFVAAQPLSDPEIVSSS